MSEPLYSTRSGQWEGSCPCLRAEQVDPECEWHGRPEFRIGGEFHQATPAQQLSESDLADVIEDAGDEWLMKFDHFYSDGRVNTDPGPQPLYVARAVLAALRGESCGDG